MSMLGTRHAREMRILFAVAKDPLVFSARGKPPSAEERHTLVRLRARGLVTFWGGAFRKGDWHGAGSEPWRVELTDLGRDKLPATAQAVLRLGAGR